MALAAENCIHWGFHEQTTALILQSHPAIEGERNIKGLPSRDVSRRTQREPTAASTHHQRPWKRLYSVQNSYTGLGKELCAQQQWDRKGWGIGMHGKDGQTSPPPREEGLQRQDGRRMGAGWAQAVLNSHALEVRTPPSSGHHLGLLSSQGPHNSQVCAGPESQPEAAHAGLGSQVTETPVHRHACLPRTHIREHTCATQDKETTHEAAPASRAELNFSSLNYLAGH